MLKKGFIVFSSINIIDWRSARHLQIESPNWIKGTAQLCYFSFYVLCYIVLTCKEYCFLWTSPFNFDNATTHRWAASQSASLHLIVWYTHTHTHTRVDGRSSSVPIFLNTALCNWSNTPTLFQNLTFSIWKSVVRTKWLKKEVIIKMKQTRLIQPNRSL